MDKLNFHRICQNLNLLGMHSYAEYLASDIWREKKRKAFLTKTGRIFVCDFCGARASEWHHRSYKRMGKERVGLDIVPICRSHHEEVHRISKDRNIGIWAAGKLLTRMNRGRSY